MPFLLRQRKNLLGDKTHCFWHLLVSLSFPEMQSSYLQMKKPNNGQIILTQWPKDLGWKLLINRLQETTQVATPQIKAMPLLEYSLPRHWRYLNSAFPMAGFLLAHHSVGSEEEMTLRDTWNTTKACSSSLRGCCSYRQSSSSRGHYTYIHHDGLLSSHSRLLGQPLHPTSPLFIGLNPCEGISTCPASHVAQFPLVLHLLRHFFFLTRSFHKKYSFALLPSICIQVCIEQKRKSFMKCSSLLPGNVLYFLLYCIALYFSYFVVFSFF